MKLISYLLIAAALSGGQAFAGKNHQRNFNEPCDSVWTAAVAVAKTQDYRVVSISKEEQIISLVAGGAWTGERILTLTLKPGAERGCAVTVQSRFSGLAHSDAPDLLSRVGVEVITQTTDRESPPFQHYKRCVEDSYNSSAERCESKLRKELGVAQSAASNSSNKPPETSKGWWQPTEPSK